MRHACAFKYIILSAANQAKAAGELSTQHVREKTSDVSEQGAELLKAWLALTICSAVSKPIRCQGIKRW